jgi:MFS transporter, FHS family, glucose/mannose:H+ symporter
LLLTATGFFVGVGIITLTPPLPLLYAGLLITGLAWGCSNNLINFLLVRETGGDSSKIATVHTSFSVGAFLAPLLVAFTVRSGISWRWASGLITCLALALIFVTISMPVQESMRLPGEKAGKNHDFFRDARFYLFMMMLFLYVGVETGMSGWLVTYLSTFRAFEPSAAQSLLSVLWISIITGRILVSVFGRRLIKARFLFLEGIGIASSALILIRSSNKTLLVLSVVLLGLSLSAFYGMVVANATYLITRSSLASGLMMALGSLGASTLPLLAGVFSEMRGIVAGLWVLFAGAAILLVLTMLNALVPRKESVG